MLSSQVVIRRHDAESKYALPGGIVQETEVTTDTLMRAFSTSAMGIKDETERKRVFDQLEQLFNNTGGTEVYRGSVNDERFLPSIEV